MVRQAVNMGVEETDDLDWKQKLPQQPHGGRWNEFAKDVAAMANTRGGLLVYGVSDDIELVGIDPEQINEQRLTAWVRNHVQPYVAGLGLHILTGPDGVSILVVDVPASEMAPHLVYGSADRDKEQQAAVVPWRDGSHTSWMPEHRLAGAYQDRFARQTRAYEELQQHIEHATDLVLGQSPPGRAWLVVACRLQRPVPRAVPPLSRETARGVLEGAVRSSWVIRPEHLRGHRVLTSDANPRPGLRRWVISNFLTSADATGLRPVIAELHHDGTAVLAVDLSWKATAGLDGVQVDLPVRSDAIATAACDIVALADAFRRAALADSAFDVTAVIGATLPLNRDERLVPVVTNQGFAELPEYARRPRHIQPVTTELPNPADHTVLRAAADELAADILNQFGLTP